MGAVNGLSGGPHSVLRDRPLAARADGGHSCIMPERLSGGKGVVQAAATELLVASGDGVNVGPGEVTESINRVVHYPPSSRR